MRLALQHPWILFVMLVLVLGEYGWRRHRGHGYDSADALASLGVALGQLVLRPLGGVVIALTFIAIAQVTPLHWPAQDWRTWAAGFIAVDFAYYWFHRMSHEVRWLWATHAVHHSSTTYILPAAVRLGWTEMLSLGWLCFAPLILLGFPQVVAILLGVNLVYQFPLHTEAVGRLGPLEAVLNTPAHHRVHHGSEAEFLDCNFGGVLIVWDRLFGTLRSAEPGRVLRYGLVHAPDSRNPVTIALHEWRRLLGDMRAAPTLRARLAIAFGRP